MNLNVEKGKQGFQERRLSASGVPLTLPEDPNPGGQWIVQDKVGRIRTMTDTRAQAETYAAKNPSDDVALVIEDTVDYPHEAVHLAKISGTIAHALDNEDIARVEFYTTHDDEEGQWGISDLRLYSLDGTDITPDDDTYYKHIDAIEEDLTGGDLQTLDTWMDTVSVKIR
jgi:hypothetical protein